MRRLEKEARARLSDFQALLSRNVAEGRKALEALLEGPLRFTPTETSDGRRFLIEGSAAVGSIFSTESVPKGIRTLLDRRKSVISLRYSDVGQQHDSVDGMANTAKPGQAIERSDRQVASFVHGDSPLLRLIELAGQAEPAQLPDIGVSIATLCSSSRAPQV